tara:strand:- start:4646 stop:4987 length:342 start_codon:yes stop_codon:yes gene_type:complete
MNKIEQLEHFVSIDSKRLNYHIEAESDEDTISLWVTRLKSSELSLEIAKGEANVMRWDKVTEEMRNKRHNDLLVYGGSGGNPNIVNSVFDCRTHHATFNNSPIIPKPKENEDE